MRDRKQACVLLGMNGTRAHSPSLLAKYLKSRCMMSVVVVDEYSVNAQIFKPGCDTLVHMSSVEATRH